MEKETREDIKTVTQNARTLLERDFAEQLEGDYDIMKDGRVGEAAGTHLIGRQRALRARIVAAIEHKRAQGMAPEDAVADYLRDAAFTTFNRFVALKMLEARGLVQECITKGEASSGFVNEFCAFAPGMKVSDGSGYRLYIECIFDELSTEVSVLFDRRDPGSALWPRKAAFDELLSLLNWDELKTVWAADETIGWVYQYFNSIEERRKMRDESQAPRNSREMAVRNQFFTPHYIVQFLVENTLGKIWFEMRSGDTKLADVCEFLVSEERDILLPREAKDPRALRVIDPACGSGHFLLYLFTLLIIIYQEAWDDPKSPAFEETGKTLREEFATEQEFREATPGMILTYNLFGVDLDSRCTQIAQLALWLRAQKAFAELNVPRERRPMIKRSNIVVAEPISVEPSIAKEFAASLTPPMLGELFTNMVAESVASSDLGSLLKIEQQLSESIERYRQAYVDYQSNLGGQSFLPGLKPKPMQQEFDLSGIDNEAVFAEAESLIVAALRTFSRNSANTAAIKKRLFAEDAAQGIAFIEVMRRKYDVVVMNPPFGAACTSNRDVFETMYPRAQNDVLVAFIERGIELLHPRCRLGAITSRTPFFLSSHARWRE